MLEDISYTFKRTALESIQHWIIEADCLVIKKIDKPDVKIPFEQISKLALEHYPRKNRANNYRCNIFINKNKYSYCSTSYEQNNSSIDQTEQFYNFLKKLIKTIKKSNKKFIVQFQQKSYVYFFLKLLLSIMIGYIGFLLFTEKYFDIIPLILITLLLIIIIILRFTYRKNKSAQLKIKILLNDFLSSD